MSISEIFSQKYYRLCYLADLLVKAYILELFKELKILSLLRKAPSDALGIIRHFEFAGQTEKPLKWMCQFLEEHSVLKSIQEGGVKKFSLISKKNSVPTIIENNMLKLDNGIAVFCQLLQNVFNEYPRFFQGKSGAEILFSGDGIKLWNRYFSNENSGYRVYNLFGARCLSEWGNGNKGKFLELGAGVGSATISVLKSLFNLKRRDWIDEYICSDISPVLLKIARQNLVEEEVESTSNISFKRLNFNQEFSRQGIEHESLSVVYGVNSLHVAKDLLFTLKEINQSLRGGGVLVIAECVRSTNNKFPFQEVIFNMLDDYRDVTLDPVYRPTYGFLDLAHWEKLLKVSGFCNVVTMSNKQVRSSAKRPELAMVIKGEKS